MSKNDRDNIIDMFDMTKAKNDRDAAVIYSRGVATGAKFNSSVAEFVHNRAVEFSIVGGCDDEGTNNAQALKFENSCMELVNLLTDPMLGSDKMDLKTVSLTGNKPMAAAFKVLQQSLRFGCDLRKGEYSTVSKCKSFNKKHQDELDEAARLLSIRETAQALRESGDPEAIKQADEMLMLIEGGKPIDETGVEAVAELSPLGYRLREIQKLVSEAVDQGDNEEFLLKMVDDLESSLVKRLDMLARQAAERVARSMGVVS